jgi:tRNA A-37 threonylcarbamoyl transferase component Bud32
VIEDVVREVAISKICSVLGVGPAVETSIPFDIVVYANALQFHLEKCEQYSKSILWDYRHQFEKDIKECLRTIHRIGIVHRDIKC